MVAAGPVFNFIMAFVFSFILLSCNGYDVPKITEVSEGFAAEQAGMQAGDVIVKMNGKHIHFYREVSSYSMFHAGETVEVTYERDGKRYTAELTPLYDEELGRYRYGFVGGEVEKGNVFKNLLYSGYEVKYWIDTTFGSLKMLATGGVTLNDMSGPVGLVDAIGDSYEESVSYGYYAAFLQMLYICILISANLGVMNLLPLPALDGGRLVFLIVEAIRGKKVDPDKEGMVHFIGLMLLMLLMVVVMFNDIRKFSCRGESTVKTKTVKIGSKVIGGGNPILIQSMTNTKTEDIAATVAQINKLAAAGCDIIRCAVPTMEAAEALTEIKKQVEIPVVADIHFDYRLAIAAIEHGADKIRINPGNIGSRERVQAVVDAAKERQIPIRVGVNSGSLEKDLVEKYHGVTAEGIVESALDKVKMIEDMGYDNLVISIKSSDVMMCVKAHELIAEKTDHPLHVGITEAGTIISGNIKSAIGLGLILHQGIGDTIRVSLTGDPLEEIKSAKLILKTLGLRKGGIEVVSCPTCGRTRIDLIGLANQVENMVADIPLDIKVAVMGCVVNGPGEAKEADIGIAGGIGEGLIIKHGEVYKKVPESELLESLRYELLHWNEN